MSDFPVQEITIYHKNDKGKYERYVKQASFRNTSLLNRDNYGFSNSDNVIIRIFDVEDYNNSIFLKQNSSTLNLPLNSFLSSRWKVQKNDVIVNANVQDEIETTAPATELSKKYGKDNVFKVNSINILIYKDEELKELNHVKLGCI